MNFIKTIAAVFILATFFLGTVLAIVVINNNATIAMLKSEIEELKSTNSLPDTKTADGIEEDEGNSESTTTFRSAISDLTFEYDRATLGNASSEISTNPNPCFTDQEVINFSKSELRIVSNTCAEALGASGEQRIKFESPDISSKDGKVFENNIYNYLINQAEKEYNVRYVYKPSGTIRNYILIDVVGSVTDREITEVLSKIQQIIQSLSVSL